MKENFMKAGMVLIALFFLTVGVPVNFEAGNYGFMMIDVAMAGWLLYTSIINPNLFFTK